MHKILLTVVAALAALSIVTPASAQVMVRKSAGSKIGVDLSGLDALAAFKARMDADAGVQRALKAEGLA